MRAGEPRVLHWLDPEIPDDGVRRARCGETSPVWRCVDDDSLTTATECPRCAEAGRKAVLERGAS
jgi:hypothetical protein